jgi:hypothetical protein
MSHTSGGRVSTVIDGRTYSARGVITLNVSNINVSAGANQDGTVFRTVAPKARTAEISFDRFVDIDGEPLRWAEHIMELETHILTGGFFTGEPTLDTSTGEVTGVALAADSYKTIR